MNIDWKKIWEILNQWVLNKYVLTLIIFAVIMIILGAAALGAAAFGVKKGMDAKEDMNEAKELIEEAKEIAKEGEAFVITKGDANAEQDGDGKYSLHAVCGCSETNVYNMRDTCRGRCGEIGRNSQTVEQKRRRNTGGGVSYAKHSRYLCYIIDHNET